MNDCISKPFQLDALVNKINNLCKLETKVNSDNEFNSNEKYIKIFSTNFIDDLKALNEDGSFNAVIEISQGDKKKYETLYDVFYKTKNISYNEYTNTKNLVEYKTLVDQFCNINEQGDITLKELNFENIF